MPSQIVESTNILLAQATIEKPLLPFFSWLAPPLRHVCQVAQPHLCSCEKRILALTASDKPQISICLIFGFQWDPTTLPAVRFQTGIQSRATSEAAWRLYFTMMTDLPISNPCWPSQLFKGPFVLLVIGWHYSHLLSLCSFFSNSSSGYEVRTQKGTFMSWILTVLSFGTCHPLDIFFIKTKVSNAKNKGVKTASLPIWLFPRMETEWLL